MSDTDDVTKVQEHIDEILRLTGVDVEVEPLPSGWEYMFRDRQGQFISPDDDDQ